MARVNRVLSSSVGGHLLMAGKCGVGRKTAVSVVAHINDIAVVSPKVGPNYGIKQFRADLKTYMQKAGVEDQQVKHLNIL